MFGKIEEMDDKDVKVLVYDMSGKQLYFNSIHAKIIPKVDKFIFVYDCTEESSFEELASWYEKIKKTKAGNFDFVVVSNKNDFSKRKIKSEEGERFARERRGEFVETTVKNYSEVEKLFLRFGQEF